MYSKLEFGKALYWSGVIFICLFTHHFYKNSYYYRYLCSPICCIQIYPFTEASMGYRYFSDAQRAIHHKISRGNVYNRDAIFPDFSGIPDFHKSKLSIKNI